MVLVPTVHHRFVDTGDARVFYREAGDVHSPSVLLLHGFPTASHQFRRLIDVLAVRCHVVAPDLPGFGRTETSANHVHSFDRMAATIEAFIDAVELDRFALYAFDFGGPVGFRIAANRPHLISALIVQNANAYEVGLSDLARDLVSLRPGDPGADDAVRQILTADATRHQYLDGVADETAVDPDAYTLDVEFLARPGRQQAQIDLALDYHSNVALYPKWQAWLREHQPPTLIVWGRNDPFFLPAGGEAFTEDVPDAELHLLDTGHFALEAEAARVIPLVADFLDRAVVARPGDWSGDERDRTRGEVMATFDRSDDLRHAQFVGTSLRGARFVAADLSGVVMRGVQVAGTDIDAPWLLEGEPLRVNGVDVGPLVEAELNRRFPGRGDRNATDPDGLRAAWAALGRTWAATLARVSAMPDGTIDASVDGEWSFAQTLRHLVFATDTWLGRAILREEQPFHPLGQVDAGTRRDGFDTSVFTTVTPSYGEVLDARASRVAMVSDFLTGVTPDGLAERRPNPHDPARQETVLSCLHTILDEEWEHHRYAVRDLDAIEAHKGA